MPDPDRLRKYLTASGVQAPPLPPTRSAPTGETIVPGGPRPGEFQHGQLLVRIGPGGVVERVVPEGTPGLVHIPHDVSVRDFGFVNQYADGHSQYVPPTSPQPSTPAPGSAPRSVPIPQATQAEDQRLEDARRARIRETVEAVWTGRMTPEQAAQLAKTPPNAGGLGLSREERRAFAQGMREIQEAVASGSPQALQRLMEGMMNGGR